MKLLDQKLCSLQSLRVDEAEALCFLLPLSADYPEIRHWYLSKVVPDLRVGQRILLPVRRSGVLVGLGIAKNDGVERKICTVRVLPTYENKGIGVRIFDKLLHWVGTDRPNLTVSQGNLPKFRRLFDYYGFSETSAIEGLYQPKSWEFGFNEFQGNYLNLASPSAPVI